MKSGKCFTIKVVISYKKVVYFFVFMHFAAKELTFILRKGKEAVQSLFQVTLKIKHYFHWLF